MLKSDKPIPGQCNGLNSTYLLILDNWLHVHMHEKLEFPLINDNSVP